jgi:hypothetical protein
MLTGNHHIRIERERLYGDILKPPGITDDYDTDLHKAA